MALLSQARCSLYKPPFRLGELGRAWLCRGVESRSKCQASQEPREMFYTHGTHVFADSLRGCWWVCVDWRYPSNVSSPLSPRRRSHNLQIAQVINTLADSDPDLFDNETATLMPVEYRDNLDIAICDAHLNNLTPYDAPAPETGTTAIVGRMHQIARWHGALQANFESELFGAPLALSLA